MAVCCRESSTHTRGRRRPCRSSSSSAASAEQAQAVRDGHADVAVLLGPFDDRGLDSEPLLTEPFLLGMAADVPLAARTSLRLADLTGWSLPDGTPAESGPISQQHGVVGARSGTDTDTDTGTNEAHGATDLPQIFKLIELGRIVCFFPASLTLRYPRAEIAYRPVEDAARGTLSVAWPRSSRSTAVAAFVRTATAVAATAQRITA